MLDARSSSLEPLMAAKTVHSSWFKKLGRFSRAMQKGVHDVMWKSVFFEVSGFPIVGVYFIDSHGPIGSFLDGWQAAGNSAFD